MNVSADTRSLYHNGYIILSSTAGRHRVKRVAVTRAGEMLSLTSLPPTLGALPFSQRTFGDVIHGIRVHRMSSPVASVRIHPFRTSKEMFGSIPRVSM